MPLVHVIVLAIDLFASFRRQSIVSGKTVNVCAPSRERFSVHVGSFLFAGCFFSLKQRNLHRADIDVLLNKVKSDTEQSSKRIDSA